VVYFFIILFLLVRNIFIKKLSSKLFFALPTTTIGPALFS